MNEQVVPRPESCHICGYGPVHPRTVTVPSVTKITTEAHWICPKCSGRFKVGTVSIQEREQKKKN
jgi:hypothetical protein